MRERDEGEREEGTEKCCVGWNTMPLYTNTDESSREWQGRWDQRAGWGTLTAPVSCRRAQWMARSSSLSHRRGSLIQRTSPFSHTAPALTGRMGSNAYRRTTTLSVSNLCGERRWAWGPWRLWVMYAYLHHRHRHHRHRHHHQHCHHRHCRHRHRYLHRSTT